LNLCFAIVKLDAARFAASFCAMLTVVLAVF
jgi:hypothetical protein